MDIIQTIKKNKINYSDILKNNSHILLFDENEKYDVNIVIAIKNRKEFLPIVVDSFQKAIKKSNKKICITIANHEYYPEHLKFCKKNKINYLWVNNKTNGDFNKSLAYNFGVKFSNKAKFYLLHDVDIIVKQNFFYELYQNIDANTKCLQPYGKRRVLNLTKELTKKVVKYQIDYNLFNEETEGVNPPMFNGKPIFGSKGGSILVDSETFNDVGGFDPELFWGYAAEDQFFFEKIETITNIKYADNPFIDMFHMWHPPTYNTNPLLYEMEAIYEDFKNMSLNKKMTIINLKKQILLNNETNY